jgi:hypothetical protein
MNITQNLCSNALRKVALLITKASDLGMDISGYGEAAENNNSGNVYLWLEDYSFCLFIGLNSDEIYASWSSYKCAREEEIETTGETLHSLTAWAKALDDAEVTE